MWQRWNQSTHIFEKSTDNGGSWTPLGLNASIITEGTLADARLSSNVPLKNVSNSFTYPQIITGIDARLALTVDGSVWSSVQRSPFGLELVDNAYWNGSSWVITNASYPAWLLRITGPNDTIAIFRAPPGSITFSQLVVFDSSGKIYERGRGVPLGSRQSWGPTMTTAEGGAVTVGGGVCYYSLVGDILFWTLYSGPLTIPATTAYLIISFPPGFVSPAGVTQESSVRCYSVGANKPGYVVTNPTGLLAYIQAGSWPAGATQYILGEGFYHLT